MSGVQEININEAIIFTRDRQRRPIDQIPMEKTCKLTNNINTSTESTASQPGNSPSKTAPPSGEFKLAMASAPEFNLNNRNRLPTTHQPGLSHLVTQHFLDIGTSLQEPQSDVTASSSLASDMPTETRIDLSKMKIPTTPTAIPRDSHDLVIDLSSQPQAEASFVPRPPTPKLDSAAPKAESCNSPPESETGGLAVPNSALNLDFPTRSGGYEGNPYLMNDDDASSEISSHISDTVPIRDIGSTIAWNDSRPEPLLRPRPAPTIETPTQYLFTSDRSPGNQATNRVDSLEMVEQWLVDNDEGSAEPEFDDGSESYHSENYLERDSMPYGAPVDITAPVSRDRSSDEDQRDRNEYLQWRQTVLPGDASSSIGFSQSSSVRSSLFPRRSHFLERARQTWRATMQRPAYTPSTVVPIGGTFEN